MKALITGGGGFLGRAITQQLLARGDAARILARGAYPEVEALGAEAIRLDLSGDADLRPALEGIDVVFHAASKTGVWGRAAEFMRSNVDGTERLLAACREAGIGRFIYTGSPSATFDGRDARGATEADCPYPQHFKAPYPESKAQAERLVLAANGPSFATTALRPHLIWGPGDPHILPRLIDRHRKGRLMQIGDGDNQVGLTYIDNAAAAHLQAADALAPGSANAGKAYFITDGEPVALWPWINAFFEGVGLPPVKRQLSRRKAELLGGALELAWWLLRRAGEPPMTRFVAAELAASHWYNLSAARADFGYAPVIEPEEALRRTYAAFKVDI
ncbi:NAD-dependent epimerase/dehydratase family protein [Myxococcota bacterium]|nr:NAD-dependent epimerase/dehydratase family protein [Myxococcota bacterium]MBU1433255.1 NAD-dependent epimerase/dehydratase family protein [Myxococcota bacterium]MBU1900630.1 NAD-dependent epimerase/dehydratase family protein [Myxococcota bacterium]